MISIPEKSGARQRLRFPTDTKPGFCRVEFRIKSSLAGDSVDRDLEADACPQLASEVEIRISYRF